MKYVLLAIFGLNLFLGNACYTVIAEAKEPPVQVQGCTDDMCHWRNSSRLSFFEAGKHCTVTVCHPILPISTTLGLRGRDDVSCIGNCLYEQTSDPTLLSFEKHQTTVAGLDAALMTQALLVVGTSDAGTRSVDHNVPGLETFVVMRQ